jgi:hypothetical protein
MIAGDGPEVVAICGAGPKRAFVGRLRGGQATRGCGGVLEQLDARTDTHRPLLLLLTMYLAKY